MLPFLKKKMEGSVSAEPDAILRVSEDGNEPDLLHEAAEDILLAISFNSAKELSEALKSFCDLRDAQPYLEEKK